MKRVASTLALLALVIGVFLSALTPALAEAQVRITADRFVIEEEKNIATFTGNVLIVQGDLKVRAAKVIVHYGSGGASDIDTLEAIGSVRIETPRQNVTGDRGIYDPRTRIMHVIGNVTTTNDSGTVVSPELEVNFNANTTEFTATDGGRVTGVFNP